MHLSQIFDSIEMNFPAGQSSQSVLTVDPWPALVLPGGQDAQNDPVESSLYVPLSHGSQNAEDMLKPSPGGQLVTHRKQWLTSPSLPSVIVLPEVVSDLRSVRSDKYLERLVVIQYLT